MSIVKKLSLAALILGMAAITVPAMAGHGPGNGSGGGTRPQDGTGNGAKKGTCPSLGALQCPSSMMIVRNGKRGGGYGPGDGSGGGTRPQDGTGNGAKKGTCVRS